MSKYIIGALVICAFFLMYILFQARGVYGQNNYDGLMWLLGAQSILLFLGLAYVLFKIENLKVK